MKLTNKSIPMTVLLYIVTCGIYHFVWMYGASQEINETLGENNENAGMEVLLTIITCGIYGLYWYYKYNRKLIAIMNKMNYPGSDNTLVCILLAILGFGIVSICIMQSQINSIAQ